MDELDNVDQETRRRRPIQRLESHIWGRMLAGLLVLIPLIVTIVILRFAVISIDHLLRGEDGFFTPLISNTPLDFPGVGVVFVLLVLYVIGVLVSGATGRRRVIDWQHAVLSRVPLVKSIYGVARQATEALSVPMESQFSRVVFIEWPREGYLALGFVTGHVFSEMSDEKLLVVYIPTVPNPTSGNMAFVREQDIVETDLGVEDAMKLVFSGGIVVPKGLQARFPSGVSNSL